VELPAVFDQASDCKISVSHYVNNVLLGAISQAKYQIFDKNDVPVVTKTLGSGISFLNGVTTISLSDSDTLNLVGSYRHECLVRDPMGQDIFILKSSIRFNKTKVRL
jgi:hypothetical protein